MITLSAGKYGLSIYYEGYGFADISDTFNIRASSSYTASLTTSSYLGGVLTLTGNDINEDSIIRVGGFIGKAIEVLQN